MACVLLLRAANVGGHQRFRPSDVVARLAALDLASVGAAGTFVARADASAAEVRAALTAALPFVTDPIVLSASDLVDLVDADPFARHLVEGAKPFVSALARLPAQLPPLPLDRPAAGPWSVRLVEVRGPWALSVSRRDVPKPLYPNEVVEKVLGVPATTRGWDTLCKARALLR